MKLVVHGAVLACSEGSVTSQLVVAPTRGSTADASAAATVLDHVPGANVQPFGLCKSLMNPQVSAATAAAQGVLTPQPCVPVTATPWSAEAPAIVIDGVAALMQPARCPCAWGGTIIIQDPGNAGVTGQ